MDGSNDITITAINLKKMDFQFFYYCLRAEVEQKKKVCAWIIVLVFSYNSKERRNSWVGDLSLLRQRLTSAG